MAYVGDPPMFRPAADEVHVSATFTWDIPKAERLQEAWAQYYPTVKVGGPAFGDPGGLFVSGRYIRDGVTITSRGCRFHCDWCFVPEREGEIRELPIVDGHIVEDNNLLACSRPHIERVFDMLRRQQHPIDFAGGIDTKLLEPWHIDLFKSVRLGAIWIAYDWPAHFSRVERAAELLADIPLVKRRCYVLIGYADDTLEAAEARLRAVFHAGFLPFAMLYRDDPPKDWARPWRLLAKFWTRPAGYRTAMKKERALEATA